MRAELLHLGEDPGHHGREGELLGEGGALESEGLVGEGGGDVPVLQLGGHRDGVVVVRLEDVPELGHPPLHQHLVVVVPQLLGWQQVGDSRQTVDSRQ